MSIKKIIYPDNNKIGRFMAFATAAVCCFSCTSGNYNDKAEIDFSEKFDTLSNVNSLKDKARSTFRIGREEFNVSRMLESSSSRIKIGYLSPEPGVSKIIVLSEGKTGWLGDCFNIQSTDSYERQNTNGFRTLIECNCKPRNGWNGIYKRMVELDILNLPNQDKLKNISRSTGGDYFSIEIYMGGGMKELFYWDILPLSNEYPEVKKIKEFVVFLETEFEFELAEDY